MERRVKNKPVERRGVVKNTSRTSSFVTKARRLLASAVVLMSDSIVSATKAEISKKFATAFVHTIVNIIKDLLRS